MTKQQLLGSSRSKGIRTNRLATLSDLLNGARTRRGSLRIPYSVIYSLTIRTSEHSQLEAVLTLRFGKRSGRIVKPTWARRSPSSTNRLARRTPLAFPSSFASAPRNEDD